MTGSFFYFSFAPVLYDEETFIVQYASTLHKSLVLIIHHDKYLTLLSVSVLFQLTNLTSSLDDSANNVPHIPGRLIAGRRFGVEELDLDSFLALANSTRRARICDAEPPLPGTALLVTFLHRLAKSNELALSRML